MTYTQLKEQMKRFNDTYYNRFGISDKEVFIKGYRHPVPFTEEDYADALRLVIEYSMLKPDELCRGKELFYKGLKWSELSKEQQESLVEYSKANCKKFFADGMCPEEEYEYHFNNNEVFYYYL